MREKITGQTILGWETSFEELARIPPLRTGKRRQFSGQDDRECQDAEIEEGFFAQNSREGAEILVSLGMTGARLADRMSRAIAEWRCGRERAFLFGGPVGRFVVARGGELASGAAVGEHGPDLARASAS